MYLAPTSTTMVFDVACELEYSVRVPSTLILGVHAQQSAAQTIVTEQFSIEPPVNVTEFTAEGTGNRLVRLKTEQHRSLTVRYSASVDCDSQTYHAGAVQPTPVSDLQVSTVPYLYPSRYCQSDQLGRLARGSSGPSRTRTSKRWPLPTGSTRTWTTSADRPHRAPRPTTR